MKNDLQKQVENITGLIHFIRGEKVILDADLARLYETPTKVLKQAVNRNIKRFPEDFMFRLSLFEMKNLRSQFVTSTWGGTRYQPFAFKILPLPTHPESTKPIIMPICSGQPAWRRRLL